MRFWLAASFLLVLAAGIAVGLLAHKELLSDSSTVSSGGAPLRSIQDSMPSYIVTSKEIYDELELDDAQRASIDTIAAAHHQRVQCYRQAVHFQQVFLSEFFQNCQ